MSEPIDYVLLHGGVQGGWVWDETIAALRRQSTGDVGRTLALDIPGCGAKRGRTTDALGLDVIAAELIADIQAAGVRDAVLVGHSQAGTVLPRLLELRPALFRQAVYVSCIAPLAGQTVGNYRAELPGGASQAISPAPQPPPASLRELVRPLFCSDMSPDQAEAFLEKLGEDAWPPRSYVASDWRYDHLDATPAAYFVCMRDAVVPPTWQEIFAQRLKVSSLMRFDAGHQVMNTRPNALAEALRRYALQAP
jgi:pimeloyl-ACP methyl ester carboxylesterase